MAQQIVETKEHEWRGPTEPTLLAWPKDILNYSKEFEKLMPSENGRLKRAVVTVAGLIPPPYSLQLFWGWQILLLPHVIKICQRVFDLRKRSPEEGQSVYKMLEFGELLMFMQWRFYSA